MTRIYGILEIATLTPQHFRQVTPIQFLEFIPYFYTLQIMIATLQILLKLQLLFMKTFN